MERTLREFMDKLRENGGWKELAGKGTSTDTKEWVLRKTAEAVLIGDEIARIQNKVAELETMRSTLINANPEIRALSEKILDKRVQVKSLNVMLNNIFGQIYAVIGAKLGDLRTKLELPQREEGMEVG